LSPQTLQKRDVCEQNKTDSTMKKPASLRVGGSWSSTDEFPWPLKDPVSLNGSGTDDFPDQSNDAVYLNDFGDPVQLQPLRRTKSDSTSTSTPDQAPLPGALLCRTASDPGSEIQFPINLAKICEQPLDG
jgi:hypothetical protein